MTRASKPRRRGESEASGQKQSIYMPEDMLKELADEAKRQDRTLSWLIQTAWRIARKKLAEMPSSTPYDDE